MTRSDGMGMEIGLLVGLLFVNLLFQFIPGTEIGRLSTRTLDDAIEAVDAFLPYDSSVEEKEEEVIEEEALMDIQLEEAIQEVTPDVTISLSTDTIGLSTVETIENFSQTGIGPGEEIGPPGFMPVEVYPNCTFMPPPAYPEIARLAGVEGVVTLWVYIDRDGLVQDVQLMHSSGVSSLDTAALAAAVNTRWSCARNNGVPVGVWTTLRYVFSLSD
ncbi:MAG: energy transducer TonB [Candidatus Sabulitectum sp.]|nr:energy transducer TonB [Candidatus Sabulitectum sp.]